MKPFSSPFKIGQASSHGPVKPKLQVIRLLLNGFLSFHNDSVITASQSLAQQTTFIVQLIQESGLLRLVQLCFYSTRLIFEEWLR